MGRGNKDFRKGDMLVQGGGCLKKGVGGGTPSQGFVSESIKKGKFVTKIFLSDVE